MRAGLLEIAPCVPRRPGRTRHRERGSADRLDAAWRCASTKIAHPEPRRRKALLSRPATATSSAGDGASRGRDRESARCAGSEPSLLRTTPATDERRPGQEIGEPRVRCGDIRRGSSWRAPHDRQVSRGCAGAGAPTSTKCGSRLAAQTAAKWPTAQSAEADEPEAQAEAERRRRACR